MNEISITITDGIFNYLLIASVVAALLTLLVWAIVKVARIEGSVYRHMIWLYVLVSIVTLPAIWLHGPKLDLKVLPAKEFPAKSRLAPAAMSRSYYNTRVEPARSTPTQMRSPRLLSTTGISNADPSRPFPIKAVLAGLWLVGTVFMFIRLLIGWFRLRRFYLAAEPVSGDRRIGDMYGEKLKILLTSRIDCPVCFGILHPVIMLPPEMYINATPGEIQMVLNHELAHIERRDCLTNLFQRIIEAVFFFHPLVWYASSQLTQQREQICDNYVIEKGARIMDYTKFLSRIAESGLEKTRLRTVALFEGRLLSRIDLLLDPGHSPKTRLSCGTALISVLALFVCFLALGTVRLEAKPAVQNPSETSQAETATDTAAIDPEIRELGEAVRKRLTTYSDEKTLTLKDGQTGRMKVKENITPVAEILLTPHISADGTKFDLEGLDAAGKAIPGTNTTSSVIHDAQSMRMGLGKRFSVDGKDIMSKIQLTPSRQGDDSVTVEVKVLFTRIATPEEIEAMLLTRGKEGQLRLNYGDIGRLITRHKLQEGHYPESLRELNQPLPKDVYSPTGEDYRYEAQRSRFILSSCGEDGIYGNDDDEIYIAHRYGATSGRRHELYPLEGDVEVEDQTERVMGERPGGNCSISGKVISAETGEPVDHATMYLHYSGTHGSIFIEVAGDGSFIFENIPTGPFSLRSTHTAGYQDVVYNPDGGAGPYPQFSLADGEHRSGIILEAGRACRISGRVLDENGRLPDNIKNLHVLAWIEKDDGQGYKSEQARLNREDGSYLIDGLSGKPAYIMAINWRAAKEGIAHPPIYYPGTFSRNEADLITFDDQWDVENIDIQLQRTGGLVLEGTVVNETGEPVPEAFVVMHRRDMLFDFVTAYTDEQGSYEIQGLGDGEFLVHVDAVHRGFVRTRMPIDIGSANQRTQLDFVLRPGVTISGKFVDEDGNDWQIGQSYGYANIKDLQGPGSSFSLTDFRNKYRPEDVRRGSGGSFSRGEGNYYGGQMIFPTKSTFIIQGMMPGQTMMSFYPKKEKCEVVGILCNGRDIRETGIETMPGQEIKDVIVKMGTQ